MDHSVLNVNQSSHLRTQRLRPSQRNQEMMSHILKISGNCRKINAVRNFKISAFNDVIYPCALPTYICVANCNKLFKTAFHLFSIKPLPIFFNGRFPGKPELIHCLFYCHSSNHIQFVLWSLNSLCGLDTQRNAKQLYAVGHTLIISSDSINSMSSCL